MLNFFSKSGQEQDILRLLTMYFQEDQERYKMVAIGPSPSPGPCPTPHCGVKTSM